MAAREEQKQATRRQLLACAKALFQQKGYDKVSTRQISAAAGVSVGTLFAHFPDKHQLTKALFHEELNQLLEKSPPLPEQLSGLDFMARQSLVLFRYYERDRALSRGLLQNAFFEQGFFGEQLNGFIAQLAQCLSRELPTHGIEQRLVLAQAFMGFYFFQLMQGLSGVTPAEQWQEELLVQCRALLAMVSQDQEQLETGFP